MNQKMFFANADRCQVMQWCAVGALLRVKQ